jgi:hypothetical protein
VTPFLPALLQISYATSREDTGSGPGEVISSVYLLLLAKLGSGIYSASNRNEYQRQKYIMEKFLGSR